MVLSENYVLKQLHGEYYLLPIGQEISNYRHPLHINETGAFIWKCLKGGNSQEKVVDLLMKEYNLPISERNNVLIDVASFVATLIQNKIIKSDNICEPTAHFQFANMYIAFYGPLNLIHDSLNDFSVNNYDCNKDDQGIFQQWICRSYDAIPQFYGQMLLCNPQMNVFDSDEYFNLLFPSNHHLRMCRLSKDGGIAEFYCDFSNSTEAIDELFYGMRNAFIYAAAFRGFFALHSASILYNDKAILFSGPSGTGKSTHTAIWERLFGTPILNGDINLIGFENDTPYVYGTPWCGTSKIYTTKAYPLGGIVLLRQSMDNAIDQLEPHKKQLLVAQRLISHSWNDSLFNNNLQFADKLIPHVPIFRLNCNMKDEAAILAKTQFD